MGIRVLTTCALATLLGGICLAAAPANLVPNGGFEDGLKGWAGGGKADAEIRHGGHASLCIRSTVEQPTRVRTGRIRLEPNKAYVFRGWMKSDGVGLSEFRMICYDEKGQYIMGGEIGAGTLGRPGKWFLFESPITTDAVRSVSVMCKLFGRGMVWFDDLYLGLGQMTHSNLLRNSGFLIQGNPGVPDFWRLPRKTLLPVHGSPEDLAKNVRVDPGQRPPLTGVAALRLPSGNSVWGTALALGAGTYCYSAYLKADSEGAPVTLLVPAVRRSGKKRPPTPRRTFRVGRDWRTAVEAGLDAQRLGHGEVSLRTRRVGAGRHCSGLSLSAQAAALAAAGGVLRVPQSRCQSASAGCGLVLGGRGSPSRRSRASVLTAWSACSKCVPDPSAMLSSVTAASLCPAARDAIASL